ncbi:MAG: L,D-transpeptidase family protein [Chloroflexota bacterium]
MRKPRFVPPVRPRSWPALSHRRTVLSAGIATAGALLRPSRVLAGPLSGPAAQAAPTAVLAASEVYFEETGHTVSGPFWQYWLTYGLDAFGYPISEPFEDGGVRNQYFQRARFELPPGGGVRLGMLGVETVGVQPPPTNADGTPLAADGPGIRRIPATGHTVAGAFLPAYDRWAPVLGHPIAPEEVAGTGYIQYFANARLEWDPFGGTRLGLLGTEVATQRGVNTEPVDLPAGMVTWSDFAGALVADEDARRAFGAGIAGHLGFFPGRGERWVLVNIPQQRVTAYVGTTVVFSDFCSTGVAAKGLTSKGLFAINRRIYNETMDSTTIGYPRGHPKYYRLENVLYTQYFDTAGTALHYAWWHNNFGWPMSYGCVNLRLSTAQWFWNWATIGTRVVVV